MIHGTGSFATATGKMRKFIRLIPVVLLLPVYAAAAITVADDRGRSITLAQPAHRIISLAPHTTELLFAAGAGGRIVATVNWADYPPAAQTIPRVGDTYSIDLEQIAVLAPDLVVAWQSGNNRNAIEYLQDAGYTLFVSEPRSLASVAGTIRRLGRLAGSTDVAEQAAADYLARLRQLRSRFTGRRPVTVFYQIWHDPVFTVNSDHLISRVIELCGGRNVFADLPVLSPRIDMEAVLAADPEVIVASGADSKRPPWLDNWRRWRTLRAVQRDFLYAIPPELIQRPSPRLLQGAERLCSMLDEARAQLAQR